VFTGATVAVLPDPFVDAPVFELVLHPAAAATAVTATAAAAIRLLLGLLHLLPLPGTIASRLIF
jgi:hypothetical protein